jgi:hypothetical protein
MIALCLQLELGMQVFGKVLDDEGAHWALLGLTRKVLAFYFLFATLPFQY